MKISDARIVFFGTPDVAVFVLEEMKNENILPSVVVTPPDRPAGRKLQLTPPPVKVWAKNNDVAVLQKEALKEMSDVEELINGEWDIFIVAAYNIIIPKWLLDVPKYGTLNVHPSLLPKLRGPSPVRTAIYNDEKESVGVTVMRLDEKVDHGPIIAQSKIELPVWPEKGLVLDEILFREGGRLLCEVLPKWLNGEIESEEQNHDEATYSSKFVKADGEICLDDDGYKNYLEFCAFDGWPGVFFFDDCGGKKTRVKITDAIFEDNNFKILKVIPEGKKEVDYSVFKENCKK
jgi:methionyl-tRNA formyltransferase